MKAEDAPRNFSTYARDLYWAQAGDDPAFMDGPVYGPVTFRSFAAVSSPHRREAARPPIPAGRTPSTERAA